MCHAARDTLVTLTGTVKANFVKNPQSKDRGYVRLELAQAHVEPAKTVESPVTVAAGVALTKNSGCGCPQDGGNVGTWGLVLAVLAIFVGRRKAL